MAAKERKFRQSFISFQEYLSHWNEIRNEDQLVISMCDKLEALKAFLAQDEIEEKCFPSLVRLISFASQSSRNQSKFLSVLNILCQSLFLTQHITLYSERVRDKLGQKQCQALITDIIQILKIILRELPNFSYKVRTAASQLGYLIKTLDTLPERDRLLNLLASVTEEARTQSTCGETIKSKHDQFIQHSDTDEPPESFQDISVVPTAADLFQNTKPFVRKAIKKGPYRDAQHYLDVQFRLMRLDFLTPFKLGIQQLRNQKDNNKFKCSDIRLYHDVQFIDIDLKYGYNHILQFNVETLSRVDWKTTDRLMTGSLVCLSKDGFQTIIIATVVRRDVSENAEKGGKVHVNVKIGLEYLLESTQNDVFLMAESVTFYDPYFHVLEGLKAMSKDFPLENVLIHCKPALKPPEYLLCFNGMTKIPMYDLSCLLVDPVKVKVPVLTTVKWPDVSLMCLNESQRDAAILALTKEVSVIQGPPGTGKTYVGLKVVQTLLMNKEEIFPTNDLTKRASPILVVCYTNHALDQFLDGIQRFCPEGIARIGGGCINETLKQYVFKIRAQSWKSFETKNKFKVNIHEIHRKMSSLRREIQPTEELKQFMLESHFNSMKSNRLTMAAWLNAPKGSPTDGKEIEKQLEQLFTKLVLKWRYTSTHINLKNQMDVFERCSLYYSKLKQFRHFLDTEIHFALRDRIQNKKVESLKELINRSYTEIFPDIDWEKSFLENVKLNLRSSQISVPQENIIRFWLLGQHKIPYGQLGEIQALYRKLGNRVHQRTADEANKIRSKDTFLPYRSRDNNCFESTVYDDPDNETLSILHEIGELQIDILEESLPSFGDTNTDNEGWQTVSHLPKYSFTQVVRIMSSTKPMRRDEEITIKDLTELGLRKRYALYMLWVNRCRDYLKKKLDKKIELFRAEPNPESDTENELALRSKSVIGMTTTGAAKHRELLEKVGCSIVIVEEAAEVLESHVITALSRNCKHLILIGDHQQLRPKPATYELERNFNLDVSLFERLILNEIPYVTLRIQHRMRPEISQIIKLIYPELEDHNSVCTFEHIRGVSKDVFFISHKEHEVSDSDSLSKSNEHEARYVTALCQYLTRQDYSTSRITILTTYKGQATLIRKYTRSRNLDVRVSVVDDFQGEENDIIILSLVRSNEEENAGFVKIDNRVCVALSRAKKGCFVMGNFDLLASKSKLWKNIIRLAKSNGMIGGGLPVNCYQHPEAMLMIKTASDFEKRPEGGCGAPCMFLLDCGHSCQLSCHGYDVSHSRYTCKKRCARKCIEGHPCKLLCSETCTCEVLVSKTLPGCGHSKELACYKSPKSGKCLEQCCKTLSCGHLCQDPCQKCLSRKKHPKCRVAVEYTFKPCGHKGQVECFQLETNVLCEVLCPAKLSCGHDQQIPCHLSPEEAQCSEKCTEIFSCGHSCTDVCTKSLPCGHSCTEKCPGILSCGHACTGVCTKSLPCGHSCTEKCPGILSCGHPCTGVCTKSLPCEHSCTEKCPGILSCGHACTGVCTKSLPCGHSCTEKCPGILSCGHPCTGVCTKSLPCGHSCKEKCSEILLCGHPCTGSCSDCVSNSKHKDCTYLVDYTYKLCGHNDKVPCFESSTNIDCKQPCTSTLKCGHACRGTCSGCLQGRVHQACAEQCRLPLPCGHTCQGFCSSPCLPCEMPCSYKCRHKSCSFKKKERYCGELCKPCDAKCMQKCKHFINLKLCSDHWDREPCREACTKKLRLYIPRKHGCEGKICEHLCGGICGEMCVCSICETVQSIKNERTNLLVEKDTENCQKEDELKFNQQTSNSTSRLVLKLPNCGHIFFVEELDSYVHKMNQSDDSSFISCPVCPKPVLKCIRYDRINVQRLRQREQKKRNLLKSNTILKEHIEKLRRSKTILRNVEECKYLKEEMDTPTEYGNLNEYLTISFRIKFLYAVSLLDFGLKESDYTAHKDILSGLIVSTLRFTQQFEMELNQEVTRCLQMNALAALENVCPSKVSENVIVQLNKAKDDLRSAVVDPDARKSVHALILQLSEDMNTSEDEHSPGTQRILETYMNVVKVLSSKTQDTLEDILHPRPSLLSVIPTAISKEFDYFERIRRKHEEEMEETKTSSDTEEEQISQRFSDDIINSRPERIISTAAVRTNIRRQLDLGGATRTRPARELTAREKTAREHKARENTAREHTSREHTARDHTVRDHTVREHKAREHTAEEHTAREQTASEHTAREHTSREHTAREHKARENTAREHTSREHTARDHTVRDHTVRDHTVREHKAREHTFREHTSREHTAREHTARDMDQPSFSTWASSRKLKSKENK